MVEPWKDVKLVDIAEIQTGSTAKLAKFVDAVYNHSINSFSYR